MHEQVDPSQGEPVSVPWWIRWFAPQEHVRLTLVALFGFPTVVLFVILGWLNVGHDVGNVISLWLGAFVILGVSVRVVIRAMLLQRRNSN